MMLSTIFRAKIFISRSPRLSQKRYLSLGGKFLMSDALCNSLPFRIRSNSSHRFGILELSKPYQTPFGLLMDFTHELNLRILLVVIVLIETYRIYPYSSDDIRLPQLLHCSKKIGGDIKFLSIDCDWILDTGIILTI